MGKVFGYPVFDENGEKILTTYDNEYSEMRMDIRVYRMKKGGREKLPEKRRGNGNPSAFGENPVLLGRKRSIGIQKGCIHTGAMVPAYLYGSRSRRKSGGGQ